MKRKTIIEIIAALLILLFVYAAVTKLTDYSHFAHFLTRVPVLANFAGQVAWSLPVTEILIAGLLAVKSTRLAGLYLSFFLMLTFIAYLALMMAFSPKLPCSCGGILQGLPWSWHLVFNTIFLALAFVGINLQLKEQYIVSRKETKIYRYQA